jgi:hypothetical protein
MKKNEKVDGDGDGTVSDGSDESGVVIDCDDYDDDYEDDDDDDYDSEGEL